MPTMLMKATVGAGKTQQALQQLSAVASQTSEQPFPRIWVLLATRRQESVFRQRLADTLSPQQAALFNVEFFNFYDLNARLLAISKQPVRRLNEPTRMALLRMLLRKLVNEGKLRLFQNIALTSGFVRNMASFIYELKQNRVDDGVFARAAHEPRDLDLATIYTHYQDLLKEQQFVDREGEAWLAVEALDQPISSLHHIALLIVDGYDQFNPVQADLLARLSGQVQSTLITLTDAGKQSIGTRFREAEKILRTAFQAVDEPLTIELLSTYGDSRPADLRALTQGVAANVSITAPIENLLWLEAPDPYQEVAAVLRQIKRRLLQGASAESCLVAVRDWGRYGRPFLTLQRAYDVPLAINFRLPLQENPSVALLMRVLELARGRQPFVRREVLDILRSPYVQPVLTLQEIDLLNTISLRGVVIEGRKQWDEAILSAQHERILDEEGNTEQRLCTPDKAANLRQKLGDFFTYITPPSSATLGEFVAWVEGLIGLDVSDEEQISEGFSLGIVAAIHHAPISDTLKARDLTALNSLKQVLRGFLKVDMLAQQLTGDQQQVVSWSEFFAEFTSVVATASDGQVTSGRDGCVLVTSATDARGLPHDHVFIVGLAESVFPAPIPQDPFYLDSERKVLRERGIPLENQSERASDEGIFFELLSLAQKSLTLSRPTMENSKPWEASYFWHKSRSALGFDKKATTGIQRLSIAKPIAVAEVANEHEAFVTAAALAKSGEDAPHLQAWIQQQSAASVTWAYITRAATIETRRMSEVEFDTYSGQLSSTDLQEYVRQQVSTRQYSATQLNNIAKCGYYWFAERLLHLEESKVPTIGFDPLIQGNINHEILEKVYKRVRDEDLVIEPSNAQKALRFLVETSQMVLRNAPHKYNFRPTSVWKQEQAIIVRQLTAVVERDFSEKAHDLLPVGRRPFLLEYAFGDNRVPLPVDNAQAWLRGKIDRVDVIELNGINHYIIIDYKTGSRSIDDKGMKNGTNFQLLTYLTALLQQHIPQHNGKIMGALFWALRQNTIAGALDLTKIDEPSDSGDVKASIEHLASHFHRIESSDFGVWFNKRDEGEICNTYCPYSQLCRAAITRNFRENDSLNESSE